MHPFIRPQRYKSLPHPVSTFIPISDLKLKISIFRSLFKMCFAASVQTLDLNNSSPAKPPPAVQIRSVWASNLEEEFDLIAGFVESFPFAAMDTEFPGVIYRPRCHPRHLTPAERYAYLKSNVDALGIVQLGLTLSDSAGRLPEVAGFPVIWEFNFCDFNLNGGDLHAVESIALLQSHGIDFDANSAYGIDSADFGALMMSSGLVCNDSLLTWVTFHSAYDFGYVIKILTNMWLPETMEGFLDLIRVYFGDRVLDLKHVMQRYEGLYGSLNRVAEILNVERVAGQCHQAGSDSLLTWQAFLKMKIVYSLKDHEEEEHLGVIFGLDDC